MWLIKILFRIIGNVTFALVRSIFVEIFLSKSKSVLIDILYRPPDKWDFVNCLECTFSNTNIIETKECYLLDDVNIKLQPTVKEMFSNKSANAINKEITHLTRTYLVFCFSYSLEQIGGNKAKGRISKRVFQESKARQNFWKTNISHPLIRTRT